MPPQGASKPAKTIPKSALEASKPRQFVCASDVLEHWDELMPQRGGTEFTPVTLKGRFEHDKEVYIGMRGKPGAVEEGLGAGYSVVTPFVMQSSDEGSTGRVARVLVNRGWFPASAKKQRSEERKRAEEAAAQKGASPSSVEELDAVIRKGEKGAS